MKLHSSDRLEWARNRTRVFLFIATLILMQATPAIRPAHVGPPASRPPQPTTRLPSSVLPEIGCWFWLDQELAPDGYRSYLDLVHDHTAYTLLTTSLRLTHGEVTDTHIHAQIKAAAAYARQLGMGIVMDLDVRLARDAFRKAYPDELQEMLRLRTIALRSAGEVRLKITSSDLSDHYTGRTTHYIPLAGRVVRIYSCRQAARRSRGAGSLVGAAVVCGETTYLCVSQRRDR